MTGCWIFRLCAVLFSAKQLAASWRIDRDFCNSRKGFTLEMSKMICYDRAMGSRAEILKVWLYFRFWYAVRAKIVRWRYRQLPVCIISSHVLHCIQLCRFLTDFLYIWFFPLNLQGNPFTIMSLSFFKLTVCARRYSHRRISKWSRLSAAGLALDCRAGGRGFDFRGRTNRAFSLTWPPSMLIYWNKRKHLHEKRVKLPEDFLGTPTWPPFHCFGTPIWPPWRHVKTLYT